MVNYDLRESTDNVNTKFYTVVLKCRNCQTVVGMTQTYGKVINDRRLEDVRCKNCGTFGFHREF